MRSKDTQEEVKGRGRKEVRKGKMGPPACCAGSEEQMRALQEREWDLNLSGRRHLLRCCQPLSLDWPKRGVVMPTICQETLKRGPLLSICKLVGVSSHRCSASDHVLIVTVTVPSRELSVSLLEVS